MSYFTPGTSTNPPIYKDEVGNKIVFDDRYGDLTIRDKKGVEKTIRLTPFRDIFDDLCYDNTKQMNGTIWINTDYVPLCCGWFMKQSAWEHEVKNKGLVPPVLSLIERTYEDR